MPASSSVALDAAAAAPATRQLPYRISTITAFSKICNCIDTNRLYDNAKRCDGDNGIVKLVRLSLNDKVKQISDCDIDDKKRKKCSTVAKKNFGNQITLLVHLRGNPVNIKLFKNGSLQVAGLRNLDDWGTLVPTLTLWLRESRVLETLPDKDVVSLLKVCMICSDFDMGVKFKPSKLLATLREKLPTLLTSHEACRHPAVKIKYMHNLADDEGARDGVCHCTPCCSGKGDGLTRGSQCRKVTVLLFHSGKVVVTGAVTLQQVRDAHYFVMNRIVRPFSHLFMI
jgi:TATA-box binding protein (TBP) (component of TFIID and TFIIIB)